MINTKNNSLNEDQLFTQILSSISKQIHEKMDLSSTQPILDYLPPKTIRNLLHFCFKPNDVFKLSNELANVYFSFPSLELALKEGKNLKVIKARPHEINLNKDQPYILDLEYLGAIIVNPQDISITSYPGIHQQVLTPVLEYIYSKDLWGVNGKWERFHKELMTIFNSKNLIQGECVIGKYSLKKEAQILENHSIIGDKLEDRFEIILPWTFSLSDLKKIKKVIEQEF